jgi:hypothetical protein
MTRSAGVSFTLLLASALDDGGWSTPRTGRYTSCRRLAGLQGRYGKVRKMCNPPGFDPRTVQPVASRPHAWNIAFL